MPFLLHKDTALTAESAASDYEKWLNDDDATDGEGERHEGGASRHEMVWTPPQDHHRFESRG